MTLLTSPSASRSLVFIALSATGSVSASAQSPASPSLSALDVASQASAPAFTAHIVGRGRPMVLISGLISGAEIWDGVIAHYRDRFEMHVLTLAGFAGVPPSASADFVAHERDAIVEYLRARHLDRPIIVGHSLGGHLAFAVGAAAPSAVGPIISLDGLPFSPALADTSATPERMRAQANAIRAGFARLTPDQLAAQLRPAFATMMRDSAHLARAMAWARVSDPTTVGNAMAAMMTTDLRPSLRTIATPLLQIGALGAYPAPARAVMRARYEAQVAGAARHHVAFADDARHFVILDDPEFVVREMDRFLESWR